MAALHSTTTVATQDSHNLWVNSVLGAFTQKIQAVETENFNLQKKLCETEADRAVQSIRIRELQSLVDQCNVAMQKKDRLLITAQQEIFRRDKKIDEMESLMTINWNKHQQEIRNLQRIIDGFLLREKKESAGSARPENDD